MNKNVASRGLAHRESDLSQQRSHLTIRLAAFVALTVFATASLGKEKRIENAPKFATGDRWVFKHTDIAKRQEPFTFSNEVTEADNDIAWLHLRNSRGEFWWKYDVKRALFIERRRFSPEAADKRGDVTFTRDEKNGIRIQFPLEVGKSYPVTDYWSGNGFSGDRQFKVVVKSYEKVKTAAGEFDAYRIVSSGYWNNATNGASGSYDAEEWYAPATKRVVKWQVKTYFQGQVQDDDVEELAEFKVSP
jgi:hypothetical protein